MKSGFVTPNGNIEIKREEILKFATDYCNKLNLEELKNFRKKFDYVNPDYEYLLRVLKWIQIGSINYGDNSYIVDNGNSLEIHELESEKYSDLLQKKSKKHMNLYYINKFKFESLEHSLSLQNGYILNDGEAVSYHTLKHFEIANSLINYYSLCNKSVNEILKDYNVKMYEDLLVTLFGFIKVGIYSNLKLVAYAPNIVNEDFMWLIEHFERIGYKVEEFESIDKSASAVLMRSLRK